MNKLMGSIHFNDIEECACNILEMYEKLKKQDEFSNVNIIAKYNEAKSFIKEFISFGFDIASISELSDADVNGYDDEYIIALDSDGIWCVPAKNNDRYLYIEADIVYVLDNCCSRIIPNIKSKISYEVEISDNYDEECSCECDGNCDDCYCYDNCDDDCNCREYCINGKEVTKEEYSKALDGISDFLGFVNKIWEFI